MAKNRMVNTVFWEDAYSANLDPIEKLLFLYFLTNSSTNICGIYQITLKKIAIETGIEKETVEKLIARFERDGKVVYDNGWLAIKNFVKHQNHKSPLIKKGIEAELEGVPETIKEKLKGIDTLSHLIKLNSIKSKIVVANAPTSPALKEKKSKSSRYLDVTPMLLPDFLVYCRKSPQRNIQVIAEWAEAEAPGYLTKGQWMRFLDRNLRPATDLVSFSNEQLQEGYEKMLADVKHKDPKTGKEVGFITKYSLETLGKYL